MAFHIIIPARFQSTRFPGKVLKPLAGKPMLQWVWERACQANPESVVIATDTEMVAEAARAWGAEVVMTAVDHLSGTERLSEVVRLFPRYQPDDIVLNLQGDEPLIPIESIHQVVQGLEQNPDAAVSTLCVRLTPDRVPSFDAVKVVFNHQGFAMYFSRLAIPYRSDIHYLHIGLYAYRAHFLKQVPQLPVCPFERAESLEQLRILYAGYSIHVGITERAMPPDVNTAEDLARAEQWLVQAEG
ncbi:MAG: 3-deoxy-manno-octulosonate cytidylyltransferase [Pseudomonadota bacterium]